jgi:L-fuconolactonase
MAGWIDAHSHIWSPDTERYPLEPGLTSEDLAPPSFTDDELMAIAEPEGVTRVVLIQHNRYHGFNNEYLVTARQRHPERFRIVGMVDSRKPKPGKAMRELLPQGVTGFRIAPARLGPDWLKTDGMREMWQTAGETRQSMCCLINPSDLADVDRMCESYPETPVVIDHFGRVGVSGEFRDNELSALCRLARHKLVRIKISAFYAIGKKQPPYDDLVPIIRRLLDSFGAERLMWASDCPYQLGGTNTYSASIGLIRDRLDFLSVDDRNRLLRDTAAAVFFFDVDPEIRSI